MNLDALSERELVNYLLMYNTDPVVQRLLSVIECRQTDYDDLVDELVSVGMDRHYLVFDHNDSPGEYISNLVRNVEGLEQENSQLQEEVDELKTKTVLDFLGEVKRELKLAREQQYEAAQRTKKLQEELDQAKSKLDTWAIMNRRNHEQRM